MHSEEAAIRRPVQLLLQAVVTEASARDHGYSDVAAATVQISVLSTLARLYVTAGPHVPLMTRLLAEGTAMGAGCLLALWCAGVRRAVKLDASFGGVEVSGLEETVSAGVFSGPLQPLLKASAPVCPRQADDTRTHARTHARACTHTRTHAHTHTHTHGHKHAHTHTHMTGLPTRSRSDVGRIAFRALVDRRGRCGNADG